jgi:hypothetical protein
MVRRKTILPLALVAGLAIALPAGAAAANTADPVAHSAGGDAPPLNPAVVGVAITRTEKALDSAAGAIDAGKGATAVGPLKASRRYLIRSYKGAKYLISQAAAAPPEEASASPRKFTRLARRVIRAKRADARHGHGWIRARASGDGTLTLADTPTAVFNVFTSQYDAATTGVGMLPDVKGNLLNRVKTTVSTAVILRNRLVKIVAAASPPAADEARAAQESEEAVTFDAVMPSLRVLLEDEIQQIKVTQQDSSVPSASRSALGNVLAADNQILDRVNTLWPVEAED